MKSEYLCIQQHRISLGVSYFCNRDSLVCTRKRDRRDLSLQTSLDRFTKHLPFAKR